MSFLVVIGLVIVGGAFCGYVALLRINALQRELKSLRAQLADGGIADRDTGPEGPRPAADSSSYASQREFGAEPETVRGQDDTLPLASSVEEDAPPAQHSAEAETGIRWSDLTARHLKQHWMSWLGGGCIALAGVFLVRYSIESGLLGPAARIVLAMIFGVAFHGVAERFRRAGGAPDSALAALAGAGSITLYAALLAALRLYDLISPGFAFSLMALVAMGTMLMARLHGPVLAGFGIVGAYLVPLLVSEGEGDIRILLTYVTIVSASALLLLRYVYRPWLWWGFAGGALAWGVAVAMFSPSGAELTLYFTLLGYLVYALPDFDWTLSQPNEVPNDSYRLAMLLRLPEPLDRYRVIFFLLLSGAVVLAVLSDAKVEAPWFIGLPFFVLALMLARKHDQLYWLPWLTLISTAGAWLLARTSFDPLYVELLSTPQRGVFLGFLAAHALMAVGLSLWHLSVARRPAMFASMTTLAPLLLLALAYLLSLRPEPNGQWGLAALTLALAYLAVATSALRKLTVHTLVVWLFIGGHGALGLAAAMLTREASLTLAIAAQCLSLAWVIRRFALPELGWLLKCVVAVVIARLTFNPWLPDYPTDIHWSLWTFGGSAAFAAVAAYVLRAYPSLAAWTGGAAVHLFVLTCWSELRYQLYDGNVYAAEFSFAEAVYSMLMLGSLALVYRYRLRFSETLGTLLRLYAGLLLALAVALYLHLLLRTLVSDAWVYGAVSDRPVFNLGTLAFAGPVLLSVLLAYLEGGSARRVALSGAAIGLWILVSLQIRHLWSGALRLDSPAVSNGELYTYSAVWLMMAMAAVLAGAWRLGRDTYRGGMVLLALVIAKLFLWDMAGLEGLLRVASFMGLGLCLLGLSFLHRRLQGIEE